MSENETKKTRAFEHALEIPESPERVWRALQAT